MLLLNTTAPNGALGEGRTPDSGLADRRVAATPRTQETRPVPDWWPPAGCNQIRSGQACPGLGSRTGASLRKMAALTGVAPASRGLKGRDPGLLDDKAEKENARPASPFNALRRTARWCRAALSGPAISQKRTHTVVPLGRPCLPDWTAAGFSCGRWADWLGSALKPLRNMGKSSDSFPGSGFSGMKKPTSGWKWAREATRFRRRQVTPLPARLA